MTAPEVLITAAVPSPATALDSWREGAAKGALIEFVKRVTTEGTEDFVPVGERIAVFDNDGTLWIEQPFPVQVAFALDRVRALAPQHPEWREQAPFKAILEGEPQALSGASQQDVARLIAETHAGMSAAEFASIAGAWFATAYHPRFQRRYAELVYQPMLEVLRYLDEHGFTSYIVSGGGVEFMRAFVDAAYGIPPERVIGSSGKLGYTVVSGVPALRRLPQVEFVDDKSGKPVAIQKIIGRRPILAFGNSDGDFEMLEWTTLASPQPHLAFIVHHTDAEREWAYDRNFPISPLDKALTQAAERRWVVIDMKRDWSTIYPFQRAEPSPP